MGVQKFKGALGKAASKSSWIQWLVTSGKAREPLDFLKMSYLNLTPDEQSRWIKRVSSGEVDQVEATIYELVTVELLRRLQLAPKYEPSVQGKTPDIRFSFAGQEFLADVFVTHSPSKAVERIGPMWRMEDAGDRAWKIQVKLEAKLGRYGKLGLPLILFVFLGDHHLLGIRHVEQALFGDYYTEGKFTKRDNRPSLYGLFLKKAVGLPPPPRNLSAVVACDWFDTLNRQDPGKRLSCLVVHYWDADRGLPVAAFGRFPQIVWSSKGPDTWRWEYTTEDPIVAKLPPAGGIEFEVYTASSPW